MPIPASSNLGSSSRNGKTVRDTARFLGGGAAANCTRVYGDNVRSVTYNAATGRYLVTFNDTQGGVIKWASAQVMPVSAGANVLARLVMASYSPSARTIQLETYTDAGAAVDLITTATLMLEFEWGSV
jgi:hypothetical protein